MKPVDLIYRDTPPPGSTPLAVAGPPIKPRRPGGAAARSATGFAISVGLHLALVACFFLGGFRAPTVDAPLAPMVVELERAAPPTPQRDVAPGPEQVEHKTSKPAPKPPVLQRLAPPDVQPMFAPPVHPTHEPDPGPVVTQTTAPPTLPAPPAPQAASDVRSTWEGQILARLEKHRRFPEGARLRRQQGVTHVRFRIDRGGRVLWSRVERSSGFSELDRAALDTLRRAQPLPAIPADRPDEVELVVPVEFFIATRRR